MNAELEAKKAKEIAEAAKKLESAKRELKMKKEFLLNDINHGRETGINSNEVKYAAESVERAQRELDRLK